MKQVSKKSENTINFDSINYKELLTSMLTEPGTISKVYSAFYTYSFQNQCLAMWQLQHKGLNITPVLPKSKWEEKGRTIKADAEPIYLCQPRQVKYEKEELDTETSEKVKKQYSFTKFVYSPLWYSYEQTTGDDLKEEEMTIPNFDFDKVTEKFKITVIPYNSINGNCQGYALVKENKISINPMGGHKEMTMLHEIAHCLLKHGDVDYAKDYMLTAKYKLEKELKEKYKYNEITDKAERKELDIKIKAEIKGKEFMLKIKSLEYEKSLKEAEAEGTAFIIGTILGFDEEKLSDSRGYIQNWFKGNKNLPERNAQNVIKTVDKMLKAGLVKS